MRQSQDPAAKLHPKTLEFEDHALNTTFPPSWCLLLCPRFHSVINLVQEVTCGEGRGGEEEGNGVGTGGKM